MISLLPLHPDCHLRLPVELLPYPLSYHRKQTRVVKIGDLLIGGNHPILIQSMLTSATTDIDGCMREIRALRQVNCELIRLTIPARKDLEAIAEIRHRMREEGILTPLVADVHFSPQLAIDACEWFEKIRINPGNFTDVSKNARRPDSLLWMEEGRARLKEAIIPLVKNLKKYNCTLRIGVNHGSLSTRMIEQYGDSPKGMVESAVEMIELFEEQGFDQLVVSLKSSNPVVAQKAYRLLAAKQNRPNDVPLHLGVTEAGNGTMGRIKGLVGIGSLLRDGLGDTIRVSLTEESQNEIIFARKLVESLNYAMRSEEEDSADWFRDLEHRRVSNSLLNLRSVEIGGASPIKLGKQDIVKLAVSETDLEQDFEYSITQNEIYLEGQEKPVLRTSVLDEIGFDINSYYSAILLSSPFPVNILRKYYQRRELHKKPSIPVGLMVSIDDKSDHALLLETELASVLSEGLVDFLMIPESLSSSDSERLICMLQATRNRTLLPDYIACPSCGRTLFDLRQVTGKIKQATQHLKDIRIGIMGCIVNGPGEMADADFGYVGSGAGKIDLYFGQERIKRGIDESHAVDALIQLIKDHNRWIDP